MPCALRLLAFLLATLSLSLPAPADAPRRTDELMHKSGLWKQLGQIEPQVKAAMAEERSNLKARSGDRPVLDELAWLRLGKAAERAYAADRLRESVAAEVGKRLSAEDEAEVLQWLDSEPGRTFTRLEEEVGEVDEFRRMNEQSPALVKAATPGRLDLVGQLAEESGGELEASMTINMIVGVAYGVASSTGRLEAADVADIRRRLEAQRPRLVAASKMRAVPMFVYAYRSMSDEDLGRYLAFSRSPAGRRYMDATLKAMEVTLAGAAAALGRFAGELASEGPGKRS